MYLRHEFGVRSAPASRSFLIAPGSAAGLLLIALCSAPGKAAPTDTAPANAAPANAAPTNAAAANAAPTKDEYAAARAALVREIAQDVQDTAEYLSKRALDPRIMQVLGRTPRHEFVARNLRPYAYANQPLPIGHGQTISQPYIVAIMTDLLDLEPECRALEVGTGSGYQAVVLAELCARVHTIEIIPPLAEEAATRLKRLGYERIEVRVGDGYYGWAAQAPFDAIIVTAAGTHVPPPLIAQLKPGGRMILPVGTRFTVQQLVLVSKGEDGRITTRQILPVAFVPLTGGH